jgi:YidC/Oxa1 family membrane protein insertase
MGDNKNFVLFAVLSLAILMGYQYFYAGPKIEAQRRYEQQQAAFNPTPTPAGNDAIAPLDSGPVLEATPTGPAYEDAGSVIITTPELEGSLSLRGARLDDLSLVNHKETMETDSPDVRLLTSFGQANSYFARFGWTAKGKAADFVPGNTTAWTTDSDTLSPGNPITLSWQNGENVTFQMLISVDDQFMFTIEQRVQNNSSEAIEIAPYGMISRKGEPKTAGLYILHEGPIGVFDGDLQELDYDDLEDGDFQSSAIGGWMGITDKFWMTTLIPDPSVDLSLSRIIRRTNNGINYRVDFVQKWQPVPAGGVQTSVNRLYSGAKIVEAIDTYGETLGIQKFDLAIDWGYFWFLTKIIFAAIHYLFQVTGNFGVAILLMTVILKLFLFPLANKSYVSMSHMKRAQPKIKALQERFGDDKAKMQQEMMALYKKEKINPMAGCLPLIPQMFIFFALYKVLYVTIEMRHQPFMLWIKDLSAADPVTPLNLFGLIPWDPPSVIAIGILPILMGISMYLMQKLNPQASMDPMQQKIMNMLPIIFTFVMAQFSAGLVLYWTWNNILSIGQQWVIMRREDARMTNASLTEAEK